MKYNFARLPFKKGEMRAAKKKMKSGKATDPGSISVKLEDYGTDKIATLLNETYMT